MSEQISRNIENARCLKDLINNDMRSSSGFGNLGVSQSDNLSSLYATFGYKEELEYCDYLKRYKRQDIAKRAINAIVDTTWKAMPEVLDNESVDIETSFEKDIKETFRKFCLLKLIKRADKLSSIGRYSIILIGTKQGLMSEPLSIFEGGIENISFFSVFSEEQARITEYVTDANSPRFGLPKTYTIQTGTSDTVTKSLIVDASRVIHIVDEVLESDIYGTPKLEAIHNLLDDLLKVCGGGSEMFWLGAYQGLVFNAKEGFEFDDDSRKALEEEIQRYVSKAQRYIKAKGIEVTCLGSSIASPQAHFEMIISLISGATNIPKRILLGSEMGELASTTDQDSFFSFIASRRNDYAEESVLRPLIDRLIHHKIISSPFNGDYLIKWGALFEQSPTDKATIANTIANAAKAMSSVGDATEVLTLGEFRETYLGLKSELPTEEFTDEEIDLDIISDIPDIEEGEDKDVV